MKRKTPKTESNLKKMNLIVLKKNIVTILKGKMGGQRERNEGNMAIHRITCCEGFTPTTKTDHYFCQHLTEAQQ